MREFLGTNVTDTVFDSGVFVISEMSLTLSSIGEYQLTRYTWYNTPPPSQTFSHFSQPGADQTIFQGGPISVHA